MGSSLVEWVAVALALAYVLFATRQSRWCWPAAGASSAIYLVLFARAGLPMQAALQVFYVVMAVYGWIACRASHGQARELRVVWAWAGWFMTEPERPGGPGRGSTDAQRGSLLIGPWSENASDGGEILALAARKAMI